jgi:hypothetical protein
VTSSEVTYDGVAVAELPIVDIDVPDPIHLRRSLRYPTEPDIDPAWAIEAALDDRALVARDPASRTGEAIRVVGFSPEAARVLVVVLLPEDHPPTGTWHVVTAWPANRRLRAAYATNDEEGDST